MLGSFGQRGQRFPNRESALWRLRRGKRAQTWCCQCSDAVGCCARPARAGSKVVGPDHVEHLHRDRTGDMGVLASPPTGSLVRRSARWSNQATSDPASRRANEDALPGLRIHGFLRQRSPCAKRGADVPRPRECAAAKLVVLSYRQQRPGVVSRHVGNRRDPPLGPDQDPASAVATFRPLGAL